MVRIAPTFATAFVFLSGFLGAAPGVSALEFCPHGWWQCKYMGGRHCCDMDGNKHISDECPDYCDGTPECVKRTTGNGRNKC
ncbi:hypothetical protein E4U54_008405 [Claviceps lovelessii]|nr:hypothetical protein E4U54_008405 [Claviceps lovelessii]